MFMAWNYLWMEAKFWKSNKSILSLWHPTIHRSLSSVSDDFPDWAVCGLVCLPGHHADLLLRLQLQVHHHPRVARHLRDGPRRQCEPLHQGGVCLHQDGVQWQPGGPDVKEVPRESFQQPPKYQHEVLLSGNIQVTTGLNSISTFNVWTLETTTQLCARVTWSVGFTPSSSGTWRPSPCCGTSPPATRSGYSRWWPAGSSSSPGTRTVCSVCGTRSVTPGQPSSGSWTSLGETSFSPQTWTCDGWSLGNLEAWKCWTSGASQLNYTLTTTER